MAGNPVAATMIDPIEVSLVPNSVMTPLDDISMPRRTINSKQGNSPRESAEAPVVEPTCEATPASAPVHQLWSARPPWSGVVLGHSQRAPSPSITRSEELLRARVVIHPVAAAAAVPSESVSAAQAANRNL